MNEIRVKGNGLPWLTVTKATIMNVVDVVRSVIPGMPAYNCFLLYGICPASVVTPLSYELYNLYNICDGFSRVRTPDEFNALDSYYVDACKVINTELNRYSGKKPDGE